ncbi:MAG: 3-keto-5-aminohexanoate cleavage protein [Solirubrobacteraceae bacterium]
MTSPFPYPAHPRTPYPPLVINVALTGLTTTRERVPHVPLTATEIAEDAGRCFEAGARVAHLHARNADGTPDHRRESYAELIAAVRDRCPEMIVCVSTSGRFEADIERRAHVLSLSGDERPDLASLTLGSLNFHSGPSVNDLAVVEELARRMVAAGIRPELEIFDLGMAHLAQRLVASGALEAPLYANLMLGFINTAPADAPSLVALIGGLPAGSTWATGGFGAYQLPANGLAVVMGGHVRTGLEDNPYLDASSRVPATNVELVARAVEQGRAAGRPVATPQEARDLLGLDLAAVPQR